MMNFRSIPKTFEKQSPTSKATQAIETAIEKISASPEIESWFVTYSQNHKKRLAFDHETVTSCISRGAEILECGAAPFILTQSLSDAGYRVTGLDIDPDRFMATIESGNLDIKKCDIELDSLPCGDNQVDCVLFNQLFEHLRINPIRTMREVFRILRPGGKLLLSTPNVRSVAGVINLFRHQTAFSCEKGVFEQYDKLETLGHMGHVREYTAAEVSDFLSKTGFEIDEIKYRGEFQGMRKNLALKFFPTFRPQFAIVATKPNSHPIESK